MTDKQSEQLLKDNLCGRCGYYEDEICYSPGYKGQCRRALKTGIELAQMLVERAAIEHEQAEAKTT